MAAGEEYKTTFQTHYGHDEYNVMPYGVIGGPTTFQGVMNDLLAPLLRRFVVVFIDDVLIYSKAGKTIFSILLKYSNSSNKTSSMSSLPNATLPRDSYTTWDISLAQRELLLIPPKSR